MPLDDYAFRLNVTRTGDAQWSMKNIDLGNYLHNRMKHSSGYRPATVIRYDRIEWKRQHAADSPNWLALRDCFDS